MKAYILLSGGIDSMACLNYYKSMNYDLECIFCNYGQPAAFLEQQASKKIAEHFQIPYRQIEIRNIDIPKSGEICGRNAMLVFSAFCKIGFGSYKIILGIHDGTNYPDCSSQFIETTNRVFDIYTSGTVILEAPFARWYKNEIISYCKEKLLPLDYTYSCEMGEFPPCGKCLSCLDRKVLLNE